MVKRSWRGEKIAINGNASKANGPQPAYSTETGLSPVNAARMAAARPWMKAALRSGSRAHSAACTGEIAQPLGKMLSPSVMRSEPAIDS